MSTVECLYKYFDGIIPLSLKEDWDNDGLMVCPDKNAAVTGVLFTLDVTVEAIEKAKCEGCNVIISHHPLIFRKLSDMAGEDPVSFLVISAIKSGISIFSFHTRLDSVDFGVNKALADAIGLSSTESLEDGASCIGLVGDIDEISCETFFARLKKALDINSISVALGGKASVKRVAVVGGSGDDYLFAALKKGADTFVTGEVHHHVFMMAKYYGINIVSAGHFHTENPVLEVLAKKLSEFDHDIPFVIFNSSATTVY